MKRKEEQNDTKIIPTLRENNYFPLLFFISHSVNLGIFFKNNVLFVVSSFSLAHTPLFPPLLTAFFSSVEEVGLGLPHVSFWCQRHGSLGTCGALALALVAILVV